MQLHDLLLRSAADAPDAPMIYDQGAWHSYRDVARTARRVAGALVRDCDLGAGDRVALLWENSAAAIAATFGVWMAGGVAVPLNTDLRGDSLAWQITHSDATVVLAGRKHLRHLLAVSGQLGCVTRVIVEGTLPPPDRAAVALDSWDELVANGEEIAEPVPGSDTDLASLIYTSGSTGEPKGVMLTHRNLVTNTRAIAAYLHLTGEDRIMMILPHFYIYGLSLVLTHALVGGSIVIDNRFMYPNTVLETMAQTQATGFAGVPSTFSILLSRSTVREMSFPALRYVTQAGGAMPVPVQQEVARVFDPARLYVMYGATEAAPRLSYLEPDDLPCKWGSIGKPVDGVELYVADDTGRRLPPGEEGELVARGENITPGYWKDARTTAQVIRDGLYFTGDLGVEDDEGFLFVTGRAKNIIKVKGYRVSPREIEEAMTRIDGIAQAAVIGVPDPVLGEAPVAFYVVRDHAAPGSDEIRAALGGTLASYKIPREFFPETELPVSAAGKVLASALRDLYHQRTENVS
ncbi:MAG: class I adenylate-forming enzyme family protein [bacterium]